MYFLKFKELPRTAKVSFFCTMHIILPKGVNYKFMLFRILAEIPQ